MISSENCKKRFISACLHLGSKQEELSKLDGEFGDGDHGVTMGKIAGIIQAHFEGWDASTPLKPLLDDVGMALLATDGGSACPLWGSFFMGMASGLQQQNYLDAKSFASMIQGSVQELQGITTAKIGDKTLMDVLLPLDANAKGFSEDNFFNEAAACAKQGAESTKNYIAKFGRAKNYGDKSLGRPDPGAVSMAYFIEGLAL